MTPTDTSPAAEGGPPASEAPAETPFPSGAAVQEAHATLAGLEPPPAADAVRQFIARVRVTGAGLSSRAERVQAQTVINYWANSLVSLPVPEVRKLSATETTLEPFNPAAAPDLSDKDCPFKGLAAFAASDAIRFFGRDEATAELAARFADHPLVLVNGPSGSGKSSLVLAGLLPWLAAQPADRPPLVLPVVIPGADPLGALAGAVRSQPRPPGAVSSLESSRLAWSAADFSTALAARAGTRPVVLVIDQFEEVFTLCESQEAREGFAEAIAAVAAGPGNRVIVTVREDYLGQTLQLAALKPLTADPDARFTPVPMSPRELRRVVERPAELVGLKFDDGIVDELVKEVLGEPTALPLLQFTLTKLWEHRNRNRITWEAYRAVGSPREALKRTADAVYEQLPQVIDRDVTRLVFLDLVQPTAGVEMVRRRVRREVLRRHAAANTVDDVLRRWVVAGLLRETKGAEPVDDRFEVAHEALTRNWPLLAEWLGEKRRTAERELQLVTAAKLWADSGRKDGFLLQGTALEEAAKYEAAPGVEELVRASRFKQERDARRTAARRLWVIGALSVLCVLLAVAWGVAVYQMEIAKKKTKEAEKAKEELTTKNGELNQSNEDLGKRTDALKVANAKIENAHHMAASSRVVQTLIRAIVAVYTAPEYGSARRDVAMRRWAELIKGLGDDSAKPLASVLAKYKIDLNEITKEMNEGPKRDLISRGMLSLELAHQLRDNLLEANDPVIESEFRLRRGQVYNKVREATDDIVKNLGISYTEATPAMREFWSQYWGEMGLFEGTAVTNAMVAFGSQLNVVDGHARKALKKELKELDAEIDKQDLWRLTRPPAPSTNKSKLHLQMYEQLNDFRAGAADLEILQKLRESLLMQLADEEKGPVHPYSKK